MVEKAKNESKEQPKVEVPEEVITKIVSDEKAIANKKAEDEQKKLIMLEVQKINGICKRIDGLAHIVKNAGAQSMEKINGHARLMMAKSWYVEVLESLGMKMTNPTDLHKPTDIGGDHNVSDPLKVQLNKAEKGKPPVVTDANDIESINHVRLDLQRILHETGILKSILNTVYEGFIYQSIKESQFWMERELYRIKDVYKQELYNNSQQGKRKLPKRPEKQSPIISTGQAGIIDPSGRRIDFNQGPKKS